MILGIKELHRLVDEQKLVENLCEREMNNPEGAGFDLRMGEIFELEGDGYLGVEERDTPNTKSVAKHEEGKGNSFVFEPGKYYLIKTMEKVNLPVDLMAIIFPRTTLFLSGLALFNGQVAPGYCGELTFGICNLGKSSIKIDLGSRVVHITFHQVLGEGNQYRGQWQGGRVSTEGKETQV
jgi:deoxycytidine triphosphate deaminase